MVLDQRLHEPLGTSDWTVHEARSVVPQLASIATTDEERYAAEHFTALCSYLDQLHGGDGFDRLLPAEVRQTVAGRISRLRTDRPTGSIDPNDGDDHDQELVGVDIDTVVRLDQPVNSTLTLAQGRSVGSTLAEFDGWQGDLGRALIALYDYLDQLYGGPGYCTELLGSTERDDIAALVKRSRSY
jgi:hypothetical protein